MKNRRAKKENFWTETLDAPQSFLFSTCATLRYPADCVRHGSWSAWFLRKQGAREFLKKKLEGKKMRTKAEVNLRGSDLRCADLSNCDLSGSNLSNCDLSDADLSGSNLSGSKWDYQTSVGQCEPESLEGKC